MATLLAKKFGIMYSVQNAGGGIMNRKEVAFKAKEYATTDAGKTFRQLLITWIEDLRQKNDTASPEDFPKNQGAIRELKLIQKAITPPHHMQEYDGAYGA
jgi:hypothetical protein